MSPLWSRSFWNPDVAIDLGTALTRVATETTRLPPMPSACAGHPALRDGVICDRVAATAILEPLLHRLKRLGNLKARVVACAPTDASAAEQTALIESVRQAGAAQVVVVPEPLAAAIGSDLDVSLPSTQLVVDVGAGVLDCALIRNGQIIASKALRHGCDALGARVQEEAAQRRLVLTKREAVQLILKAGVAPAEGEAATKEAGRNWSLPVTTVQRILEPEVQTMLRTVTSLLDEAPDRLVSEVIENNILLTGGGSLIPNLSQRLAAATGIHVTVSPRPLDAVIDGARAMLPVVRQLRIWKQNGAAL